MRLESGWVELSEGPSKTQGWATRPAAAKGALPGLVVIQEVWGVDDHIRDVADRFATAGFAVISPDLLGVGGKPESLQPARIEEAKAFLDTLPPPAWWDAAQRDAALATRPADERTRLEATLALLLTRNRPFDLYEKALKAGFDWLANGPANGRKIGATGFCMGGSLALRLAGIEPRLAACVTFYGAAPGPDYLAKIRAPVMGHYAEVDPNVNGTIPALEAALKASGTEFSSHTYVGAKHAFVNDTRTNYHADAARLAWARTLGFFAERLG